MTSNTSPAWKIRYNRQMQLRQAFSLLQQGHLDQAKAMCAELLDSDPEQSSALMLMSAILHRQGEQQAAVKFLLQAARLQAGDPTAQIQLARALRNMGAFSEAGDLLECLDKNSPDVVLSKTQLCWQSGEYVKALDNFASAVDRWPDNLALALAYCRALVRLGHVAQGEKSLKLALNRWPQQAEILHLLAVLYLDQSKSSLAIETLEGLPEHTDAGSIAKRLQMALQGLDGKFPVSATNPADAIDESFNWVRNQSGNIHWFGTNTGLLKWALKQLNRGLVSNGPVVECGVYHGFSLSQIASGTLRPVHGFDSFEGLPQEWKPGEPAGSYSTRGKVPATAANVQLHRGWFEETLPGFAAQLKEPIALLHVDCDLYSSTRTVLTILGPKLGHGSLLVFDDFLAYAGYQQHEFRAAHEYFNASGQRFDLVGAVLLGRAVAYRLLE